MQGWMHGWIHLMSTLGTFASVAAGGLEPARNSSGQSAALGAMRNSLLPLAGTDTAAARAHPATASRRHGGRRDIHAVSASTEHAFASAEPKRRRGTSRPKAKSRRSRSA
jgi:hypothetical protein